MENIRTLISSPRHSDPSREGEESQGNVDFIQGSITELPLLLELFRGVDYVFHQAALLFNIGGGKNSTVNNLAKTIINLMGKDLQPEYHPPRPGDVKHSLADISRARAIGCNPEYNLDSGLRESIKRLTSAS